MGSDREYLRESLRERIHLDHLSYLGLDESPSKIAKWSQLECLVEEFLSVVPHREKFYNQEVLFVLSDSAATSHFSAYKAAAAFQCIEKYATNLLCQPWRKEFWTIQVYSGYYKHMIEGPLPRAEVIFQAMGYWRPSESGLVMREPLDPDKIARVALDCLMAVVECQIMVRLSEDNKGSSWSEVYRVRQAHVGSVAHSLHMLKLQEKPAEGILIDISNGLMNRKESKRINIQGFTLSRSSPAQAHSQPRDDPTMYTTSPYLSPTIPCWPRWDFIPAYPMVPPPQMPLSDIPMPSCKVKSQKKMKADVPKKPSEVAMGDFMIQGSSTRERKPSVTEMYDNVDNDKRYAKMDSYFNEQKPVLPEAVTQTDAEHERNRKPSEDAWPVEKNAASQADMQVNFNVNLTRKKLKDVRSAETKPQFALAPSFDIAKNEAKSEIWPVARIPSFTEAAAAQQLDHDRNRQDSSSQERKLPDTQSSEMGTIKMGNWSCPFCTFLNTGENVICDMCSHSKGLNESVQQLKSGGRQCPSCTLVNDSKAQTCSACDKSLKDSPTYI